MLLNWRSLLFVPADNRARCEKALTLNADAVILDLEDGVPPAAKEQARRNLAQAAQSLSEAGIGVAVRINTGWRNVMADLTAAVTAGVQAIMLPKVESPAHVQLIGEIIDEFAMEKGLVPGSIKLIALIESPIGLTRLHKIAAVEGLAGLALGTEDFCLELGVTPLPDVLEYPAREIALAASARGLMALAVPISIAEFRDVEAYSAAAKRGAGFGATGAICIHPAQVGCANACFQPSEESVAKARAIDAVWEAALAEGKAVTSLDGMMVDLPVALRAKRVLQKVK